MRASVPTFSLKFRKSRGNNMDTFECIRKRRDIRSFIEKEVSDEVIMKIIEAGRLAPSAMNLQPWDFIVIKDNQTIKALGPLCTSGKFVVDASFAVVVVTDPSDKWHEIDGARAVQNMALAGWNEGVGCCWIGAINRERVKEMLNIPQNLYVLTILPFGYPEQFTVKRKKNRKSLDEIFHREKFGVKL
jgi:nitroreductase